VSARSAIQQAVKGGAAALDVVRRPCDGLTVLIYHRVGGPGGSVDLEPAVFEDQMAELAATARVRTIDDALDGLAASATTTAADAVVVTFDDGTADFVEHALPILVRHGVPALLYVATRFVDEGIDFPGGGPAVSWAGLADAVSTGLVEVGGHTHAHVLLDRLPAAQVADELDRSNGLIEDHLGRPARHFAYPKALLGSPEAEAEVRRRYRSAAVAGTRRNRPGATDLHRLARSPIQVADRMRWFRRKVDGGLRAEDDLRRLVNRRRYAGATT
jgi:peptidoglycan/xylan/chitin deacetylase (PgdA/CDA1 family)